MWPDERGLRTVALSGAPEPVVTPLPGGFSEFVWDLRDPEVVVPEDRSPPGDSGFSSVHVTEDGSWADVARWAEALHTPGEPGPALRAQLAEWSRLPLAEDRVDAVLDFVQRNVRYVGVEIAEGTHRPASPDVVFDRRFGDCKDQTTLVVSSLRALGVPAWPALVNTRAGVAIDRWPPSRHAFDHVIAAVELDGRLLFLDPTVGPQGDPPSRRPSPPWRRALLVRTGEVGLTEIALPTVPEPTVTVDETWTIARDHSATLTVRTERRGAAADAMRRELVRRSPESVALDALNFYAGLYAGISGDGPLVVDDDDDDNLLTTTETYTLSDAWATGEAPGLRLVADTIRSELVLPQVKRRSRPLTVAHPVHVRHQAHVTVPSGLPLLPERERVERPELVLEYTSAIDGHTVHLTWDLRSGAGVVPADEVADHLAALDRAYRRASFLLPPPGRSAGDSTPFWVIVALVASLAGVVALGRGWIAWARSQAASVPFPPVPEGQLAVVAPGQQDSAIVQVGTELAASAAMSAVGVSLLVSVAGGSPWLAALAGVGVFFVGLAVQAGTARMALSVLGPCQVAIGPDGLSMWGSAGESFFVPWAYLHWVAHPEGVTVRTGPAWGRNLSASAFPSPEARARFVDAGERWRAAAASPPPRTGVALTSADLVAGITRATASRRRGWWVSLGLTLAGGVAVALAIGPRSPFLPMAAGAVTMGVMQLARWRKVSRAVDDLVRDWPALLLPRHLVCEPEHLRIVSDAGTSRLPWRLVHLEEDDQRLFVVQPDLSVCVVRKADLPAGAVLEMRRRWAAARRPYELIRRGVQGVVLDHQDDGGHATSSPT